MERDIRVDISERVPEEGRVGEARAIMGGWWLGP